MADYPVQDHLFVVETLTAGVWGATTPADHKVVIDGRGVYVGSAYFREGTAERAIAANRNGHPGPYRVVRYQRVEDEVA